MEVGGADATRHMLKSEDNFCEFVFSYHMGLRDRVQTLRLSGRHPRTISLPRLLDSISMHFWKLNLDPTPTPAYFPEASMPCNNQSSRGRNVPQHPLLAGKGIAPEPRASLTN